MLNLKINYENDLNEQQLEAVQNGDGSALILAGAGSGKTRTITYRVAWLLENGISPERILLLTFTNKAAKEMIERVQTLIGSSQTAGLWAGTFHSVANRLLRKYAPKLGFKSNFSILDQDDSKDLISLCIKELGIDTKTRKFPKPGFIQDIISYSRNKNLNIEEVVEMRYEMMTSLKGEISAIAESYERLKKAQNAMDFDDLLLKFLELLETDIDIQQRLADQFQYVLVDEFQDTNAIQARIVERLCNVHKNIFVVGDDAQSIYSFRAAEIQNILNFSNTYQNSKIYNLTKNYRSTPEILSVANSVIENNTDQFEKKLEAVVENGQLPHFIPANSQMQEAHFVADKIEKLYRSGIDFENIAVLFRAAFHSQALEFELMRRNVKYEYRGGLKFFERAHIKDAIAHLRLIHNVKDIAAWMRALRIHSGIGLLTAQKIAKVCSGFDSIDQIKDVVPVSGARALQGWNMFLSLLSQIQKSLKNPADYVRALAASEIYKDYLTHEYQNASDRIDDLEQFVRFAERYNDLQSFLDDVALTQEYGDQDQTPLRNRLILSTVHQAKGLEWDHVFVINLSEGSFPNAKCVDAGELEEERRLFYVAITRARQGLYMTYPMTMGKNIYDFLQPSMFIDEIPDDQYEKIKVQTSGSGYGNKKYLQKPKYGANIEDEPIIVLDDMGEKKDFKMPSSFLRNIDEL